MCSGRCSAVVIGFIPMLKPNDLYEKDLTNKPNFRASLPMQYKITPTSEPGFASEGVMWLESGST